MLQKIGQNRYLIPKEGDMQVEGYVYLSENLLAFLEDEAIKQLKDAATLPGIHHRVIGMPDIHTGFGLPIGGIMATRVEDGVISAGAVGMDINCGVRLLTSPIPKSALSRKDLERLLKAIVERVPVGVGKRSRHSGFVWDQVMKDGATYLVKEGYGMEGDLISCEEGGCLAGADPTKLTKKALGRVDQLATLGGGNHFMEIVYVSEVYDKVTADSFGVTLGNICVLIHTGSRGLGHQTCTDYTEILHKSAKNYGIKLPGKGLAAVPVNSNEGRAYYAAMACCTNFALANRQLITHDVREAFCKVLGETPASLPMKLVYDVCHNIAKFEKHGDMELLVHRKGAVQALPPKHPNTNPHYQGTGNPVLVPGSMGHPSYVIVGTALGKESFYSVNHGAGRILSRTAAQRKFTPEEVRASMGDTLVNVEKLSKILDEAPMAYKNVQEVVDTLVKAGLTRKVVQLKPLAVIKGED